jgi:hypothetical protein
MKNSTLSEHKIIKGVFKTKISELLGSKIDFQNWAYERMPEYSWLGLIMSRYGRDEGFKRTYQIVSELSKADYKVKSLRLSDFLALSSEVQKSIFEIISKHICPDALSPLTTIIDSLLSNDFCIAFLPGNVNLEVRIDRMSDLIRIMGDGSSEFATDIRFIVIYYHALTNKIKFTDIMSEKMFDYPNLKPNNPIMVLYGSMIRSLELTVLNGENKENSFDYLELFWERMFRMTNCELMQLRFEENVIDYSVQLAAIKSELNSYKIIIDQSYPFDEKKIVSLGIALFSYKRVCEIVECHLETTIAGRSVLRGIIDSLFMLKYLVLKEGEVPDIWRKYQLHGIGKYKLISEKYIEIQGDKPKTHVPYEYLDILVNEFRDKEFVDMETGFFDNLGPRKLAELVDEKDLYNFFYDYDSSYEHALWGAIRESSFLKCTNPSHLFHYVPDIDNQQKLQSVLPDAFLVMDKIIIALRSVFETREAVQK